jgi:CheY-like chemotaxis protein
MSAASRAGARMEAAAEPLILVVDDYVDLAEPLARLLRRMGYAVESVYSGDKAIERLVSRRPQLVILDLLLPGISGLQVLSFIRGHPDRKQLPVMVYTTATESELLRQAVDAGATEVWLKGSMDFFQIVTRVQAYLARPKGIAEEDDR